MAAIKNYDIVVIGGGVIGVNTAFWLSELFDCEILILDKEPGLAFHQSSRNTCGVHRPVMDDPSIGVGKILEKSYHLWRKLAQHFELPFLQLGRLTLALEEEDAFLIQKYLEWGIKNGVPEEELSLLNGEEVALIEPRIKCVSGLYSKTESMTGYGELIQFLYRMSSKNGVKFGRGMKVERIIESHGEIIIDVRDSSSGDPHRISCSFLINAAGGAALDIAHMLGLGRNLTDISLRCEFWIVDGPVANGISKNIYPVTRHGLSGIDLSFTGPHFVNRYEGLGGWKKEIGPTAFPVSGAYAYKGFSSETAHANFKRMTSRPFSPWFKLFGDPELYRFVWNQWRLTNSKRGVVNYLKRCIPSLDEKMVIGRGTTGIISEFLGNEGVISNPFLLEGESSLSIFSTGIGATGAPVFCAGVVEKLRDSGQLGSLRRRDKGNYEDIWAFDSSRTQIPQMVVPI